MYRGGVSTSLAMRVGVLIAVAVLHGGCGDQTATLRPLTMEDGGALRDECTLIDSEGAALPPPRGKQPAVGSGRGKPLKESRFVLMNALARIADMERAIQRGEGDKARALRDEVQDDLQDARRLVDLAHRARAGE